MKQFENHQNYNCKITADSGEEYLIYANWLHNEKLDYFKDWQCEAGVSRILIDKNFEVFSGECYHDQLGNALTNEFNLKSSTTCKKERCSGCTDDLLAVKHKI